MNITKAIDTTQTILLLGRCATCKYWQGDKAHAIEMYEENPASMNLDTGWATYASCSEEYIWSDISVKDDAVAFLEVAASFGCVCWEPLSENEE